MSASVVASTRLTSIRPIGLALAELYKQLAPLGTQFLQGMIADSDAQRDEAAESAMDPVAPLDPLFWGLRMYSRCP
jgi:hypothetical protein